MYVHEGLQTYLSQRLYVGLSLPGGHRRSWQWPALENKTQSSSPPGSLGHVTVMWAHTYIQDTLYSGVDLSEYMVRASVYSECSRTSPRHSSNFSGPMIRDEMSLFLLHCSSLSPPFVLTTLADVLQGLVVPPQVPVNLVTLIV